MSRLCRFRTLLLDSDANLVSSFLLLRVHEITDEIFRYYTNVWHFSYLPISSTSPFDREGKVYDVQRVLTPQVTLNLTAYEQYSPLYLPANYAMTYLVAFAMSTCVLVHTGLYHGRSLLNQIKKIKGEPDDIHAKLMRNYPEVPDWWYGVLFSFFFLIRYWKMNPVANQEEKLIPVAGGIWVIPFKRTGVLMTGNREFL